jgi:hypothetical protein
LLAPLAALIGATSVSTARADEPGSTSAEGSPAAARESVALYVEESGWTDVGGVVAELLSNTYTVKHLGPGAMRLRGLPQFIGPRLAYEMTRGGVVMALTDATASIGARATFVVVVEPAGPVSVATLYVLVPGQEPIELHATVPRGSGRQQELDRWSALLAPVLPEVGRQLATHPAPPPPPASTAPPPPAPLLTLGAGADFAFRTFSQREPSTGEMRFYRASAFAGVEVVARLRALVLAPRVYATLEGDLWHAFALASWSTRELAVVNTTSDRFGGTLALHFKTSSSPSALDLSLEGRLARWTFDFDLSSPDDLEVPTGDYTLAGGGLGLRLPILGFSVLADARGSSVLSTGTLGNRSASTRPLQLEGTLGVTFSIAGDFDITLYGQYALFAYKLAPLPKLGELPAQVTDEYVTIGARLGYAF